MIWFGGLMDVSPPKGEFGSAPCPGTDEVREVDYLGKLTIGEKPKYGQWSFKNGKMLACSEKVPQVNNNYIF